MSRRGMRKTHFHERHPRFFASSVAFLNATGMLRLLFWFSDELYFFVRSRQGYPDIEAIIERYLNPEATSVTPDIPRRVNYPLWDEAPLRSVPDTPGPSVD